MSHKENIKIVVQMTDDDIEKLIKIKKEVESPPLKNFKLLEMHKKNDFTAKSAGNEYHFKIFLRQNLEFQENFSIGLIFTDNEGKKYLLLRMNGNHGEVVKNILNPAPHFNYHIHTLTAEDIENEKYLDPSLAIITDKYSSFEQAIEYFMRYINLIDADKYFTHINQLTLFNADENTN